MGARILGSSRRSFDGVGLPHADPYGDCRNRANPFTPIPCSVSIPVTQVRQARCADSRLKRWILSSFGAVQSYEWCFSPRRKWAPGGEACLSTGPLRLD
jgi:hypothetical protein